MGRDFIVSRRRFLAVGATAGCAAVGAGLLGGCADQQAQVAKESAAAPEAEPDTDLAETAPVEDESFAGPVIYLVDRLVAKPGLGREVHDAYLEHFEAVAAEKSMTLDRAVIAPPIWLTDPASNNTLEFTWAFQGYPALAAAISYGDASVTAWWRELEEKLESRDRSYFASEADVEVLNQ